jgi:hypothetical protein
MPVGLFGHSLESVKAVYLYFGLVLTYDTLNLQIVQRLFAMFPEHGPGIALLLLRFSVAATVWLDTSSRVTGIPAHWIFLGLVALSLSIGFLVPILSVLCCVFELMALTGASGGHAPFILVSVANAAALALLGPGAYSLDARLFGRRVLIVPVRKDREVL